MAYSYGRRVRTLVLAVSGEQDEDTLLWGMNKVLWGMDGEHEMKGGGKRKLEL
jgi:hypothetical protein